MLLRNPDEEEKNKSFFHLGVPWKRNYEWKPHTKARRATILFHASRRIVLHHCPIHPLMRQEVGEKGVIPNLASVPGLRDEGDWSCTKANALTMACQMAAINIFLYSMSSRHVICSFLWKILNTFTSSIGKCHCWKLPLPSFLPSPLPF